MLYYGGGFLVAAALGGFNYSQSGSVAYAVSPPIVIVLWWLVDGLRPLWPRRGRSHEGNGPSAAAAVVPVAADLSKAHAAAVRAVQLLGPRRIDVNDHGVRVRTGPSSKIFGEEVSILLFAEGESTRLTITSRLVVRSLTDYGKNEQNVRVIVESIKKDLPVLHG